MAKSKDGEDGEVHPFRLDVVEVDTDEDGEAITSCVIVPEENIVAMVRRAKVPSGGNQRIVWDALGEWFRLGLSKFIRRLRADSLRFVIALLGSAVSSGASDPSALEGGRTVIAESQLI